MLSRLGVKTNRYILLYCEGVYQIPLFLSIIQKNPDCEFFLHSDRFGSDAYLSSAVSQLNNSHFVQNFNELKYKMHQFGSFITTDCESAFPHAYSLRIVWLCNKLGIPVFEIQHGMFQLGLHYYDVPQRTNFAGDSLPAMSFSSTLLLFYQPGKRRPNSVVIGYPPYDNSTSETSGGEDGHILILSNLHWATYTDDERRGFYEAVCKYVFCHAEAKFIWRQHLGEASSEICKRLRSEMFSRYPGIDARIVFSNEDARFEGTPLQQIIAGARLVVSTVSTVLLDCEIAKKRTILFSAPSVACLVDLLQRVRVFKDFDGLSHALDADILPIIETGMLIPYDNDKFRTAIASKWHKPTTRPRRFLDVIMSLPNSL